MKRVRRWLSASPLEFNRWDHAAKIALCPTWQRWAKLVLMAAAEREFAHAVELEARRVERERDDAKRAKRRKKPDEVHR